jgi:crossover junction endodeoxyribonuclease RuvC
LKIISLDMATTTGWCVHGQSGTFKADLKRGESPGMRFLRFRAWLRSLIESNGGVDLMVFERAHHRGGAATQLCVGLMTEALTAAAEHGANTMPVHSGTLKKWATGSGAAGKPAMIQAAKRMGYKPVDDNEADACLLFEYAKAELGIDGDERDVTWPPF